MLSINRKQKQRGFTLVEVIVVAVIVAAMAAVAVPLYLAYIDNSRLNAATNAAGSVASFLGACRNSSGAPDILANPGDVAGGATSATITCVITGSTAAQPPALIIPANIEIKREAAGFGVRGNWLGSTEQSPVYSY